LLSQIWVPLTSSNTLLAKTTAAVDAAVVLCTCDVGKRNTSLVVVGASCQAAAAVPSCCAPPGCHRPALLHGTPAPG
jgi:hypothetical protein